MWLELFGIAGIAAIAAIAAAIKLQPAADLLLFRLMRALNIDADKVSRTEPLFFCELEARCRACHSRERCARDLACSSDTNAPQAWRAYCPNRAALDGLLKVGRLRRPDAS
jgi:hypothetical protein